MLCSFLDINLQKGTLVACSLWKHMARLGDAHSRDWCGLLRHNLGHLPLAPESAVCCKLAL